ncbi:hypothetical protein M441DRAFT_438776 [Trichoderma asperellum CBS 433.97]|uniref:Secreted protein n=1 Tax=Trichoderma asperellum (strain ATCC 204424 / CBS 433.97 / NBRC 101777) TaxID=1042311 RepID=A0A2T3Z3W1_TRIA4|nr:hypothetical protein M441DRAFT_438776 [Trichoderma asperellum CBS 433.97]PTB39485.1 hypothetical protein M441DRAFT_438776 [Trichoderma asperellum CBS 433.97]
MGIFFWLLARQRSGALARPWFGGGAIGSRHFRVPLRACWGRRRGIRPARYVPSGTELLGERWRNFHLTLNYPHLSPNCFIGSACRRPAAACLLVLPSGLWYSSSVGLSAQCSRHHRL